MSIIPTHLEVGNEVQLDYNGVAVTGIIRYIGTTDFSPGKWCGIELAENIGRHNGTVNGKCYFICQDSYGIFLRFNKVSDKLLPIPETGVTSSNGDTTKCSKDVTDTRIRRKSVKASKPMSNVITNSNSKSSMKSYTKTTKDKLSTKELLSEIRKDKENSSKLLLAKNVVVSSFTTPAPVAPVVVTPRSTSSETTVSQSDLNDTEAAVSLMSTNNELDDVFFTEPDKCGNTVTIDLQYRNDILQEEGDQNRKGTESPLWEIEIETPHNLPCSKIPRRITSVRKTSGASTIERPKPNSCSDYTGSVRKFSRDSSKSGSEADTKPSHIPTRTTSDTSDKNATPFPRVFRSSKRGMDVTTVNNKLNEQDVVTKMSSGKGCAQPRSTPSVSQQTFPTTVSTSRRASAPVRRNSGTTALQGGIQSRTVRKEAQRDVVGGKKIVASNAMGNASDINASCYKTPTDSDADVTNIGNLPEMVDSIVIHNDTPTVRKKKDGRTQKSSIKSNLCKSFKDTKALQKEVDNLQNQLKERIDRINELEITMKNNKNKNLEDRNEFARRNSELENALNENNSKIVAVEGRLSSAQLSVSRTSTGFEALGLVLQYYLHQIEKVTKQLTAALDENARLSNENGLLYSEAEERKAALEKIITDLDVEKARCETLRSNLEEMASNHEVKMTTMTTRHIQEQEQLRITLKEETEERLNKSKEEHHGEIERFRGEHRNEIVALTMQHENKVQEVAQEKERVINEMMSQHESFLEEREAEHADTIEELTSIHEEEVNLLNELLSVNSDDKGKLQNRIKELVNELESDDKVQAALLPYKHLPDELQSLQVVLELRNEEIKNNRLKTMELKKKVDEYYELKTKFDTLSQENASLRESLSKRTLSERQLSVERDTLVEKFENEMKKVNLLSMEKEQLMWQASNPDLGTSLPNVFEDVGDEGCFMSP